MKKIFLFCIIYVLISMPMVIAESVPRDFIFEISKGTIPGHSCIHNFGHNSDVGNAWVDIWDYNTLYTFMTVATPLNVSSTDINDDFGSTGAWNVTLIGLDANFAILTESVIMDGQNNVTTTNAFIRLNLVTVEVSGATGTNEGDIYVGVGQIVAGVPATVYAQVPVGMGQSLMAIYTIPVNKTGFMLNLFITLDEDKSLEVALFSRPVGGTWNVKERLYLFRNLWQHEYFAPKVYEERTDIVIRAQTGVGVAAVSAGWSLILVDDDVLSNSTLNWEDGSESSIVVSGTVSTVDPTTIFSTFIGIVAFGLLAIGIWRRRR